MAPGYLKRRPVLHGLAKCERKGHRPTPKSTNGWCSRCRTFLIPIKEVTPVYAEMALFGGEE